MEKEIFDMQEPFVFLLRHINLLQLYNTMSESECPMTERNQVKYEMGKIYTISPSAKDGRGVGDLRGDLMGVGIPDARRPPPVLLVSMGGGRLGVDCFVTLEEEDAGEAFFPTLLLRLLLEAASCFWNAPSSFSMGESTSAATFSSIFSSSSSSLSFNSGVCVLLLLDREVLSVRTTAAAAGVLDLRERVDGGAAISSSSYILWCNVVITEKRYTHLNY